MRKHTSHLDVEIQRMIVEERKVVNMARLENKKRDSILRAGEQLF